MSTATFGAQLGMQVRTEGLRLVRNFAFIFFTMAFPALFYILMVQVFGSASSSADQSGGNTLAGLTANVYMLVSMTAYGIMGAGLNLFGTRLAIERSRGWMRLLRTTPLRGSSTLLARWVNGLAFSALIVLLMAFIGASQGVALPGADWLRMGLILWLGALPFGALGLALGYWIDERSGQVITMMIYFFLSIFGGLWWPVDFMPQVMQNLAHYLPSYQYAQLTRLSLKGGISGTLVAWLVAYTALFLLLAWQGWRRDEGRVYR